MLFLLCRLSKESGLLGMLSPALFGHFVDFQKLHAFCRDDLTHDLTDERRSAPSRIIAGYVVRVPPAVVCLLNYRCKNAT